MWIIEKIFRRRPKGYSRPITLRYSEKLVFNGYYGTGDQLFSKELPPLPPLIYHAFGFALDGNEYEIWVKEEAQVSFQGGQLYRAFLNADGNSCWFDGHEALVRRVVPDQEGEEEAS